MPSKYIPKPCEQMCYPGQRGQIDIKYVPKSYLVGTVAEEDGYYQYAFLGEYSRFQYLRAFPEHRTYSSARFIQNCVREFPFAIECVQADNGPGFTNWLNASATQKSQPFLKSFWPNWESGIS